MDPVLVRQRHHLSLRGYNEQKSFVALVYLEPSNSPWLGALLCFEPLTRIVDALALFRGGSIVTNADDRRHGLMRTKAYSEVC